MQIKSWNPEYKPRQLTPEGDASIWESDCWNKSTAYEAAQVSAAPYVA